jgi:hypothetical protein
MNDHVELLISGGTIVDMSTPSDHQFIDIRTEGRVAVVTMNRPDRLNALGPQLVGELIDAFHHLHRTREVRSVVIEGAGAGFCSGADLVGDGGPAPDTEGRGPVGVVYRTQEQLVDMILAIHECDKPVVAAVNGRIIWADVFASSSLLEKYWPKLVRSYAAEAYIVRTSSFVKPDTRAAQDFLDNLDGRRQVSEVEPGVFRQTEISGDGFKVFELTSLLPKTGFDLHIAKAAE